MEFSNNKSGNGGFITLTNDNNEEVGRLTYTVFPEEKKLVISYVLVHPQFEGQGMGKKLVDEAIGFSKENDWKIVPHCSYARSVIVRMDNAEEILY